MSIKHRIAEKRRERGLSQRQLADRIGATQSMVGKLERGEREMTFSWLTRIASVLEIPTGDLLDASDEPARVGLVAADGRIQEEVPPQTWVEPDGLDVEVFHIEGTHEHKIAVEIIEDVSMRIPAGSLFVYEGPKRRPAREMAGRLVIAWTTEKPLTETQAYVARVGVLMPGSDSRRYHLIPFSGPPLTDISIHYVCEIAEVRL